MNLLKEFGRLLEMVWKINSRFIELVWLEESTEVRRSWVKSPSRLLGSPKGLWLSPDKGLQVNTCRWLLEVTYFSSSFIALY